MRARLKSLEDFIDGYVMPVYVMEELESARAELSSLHAKIDAKNAAGLAEEAKNITDEKKLAPFLTNLVRLCETNLAAFDSMMRIIETAKEQMLSDEPASLLIHMLETVGVQEMFMNSASVQAQMLGAIGRLPKKYRALEKTREVEDSLWRRFAAMIVRSVGGTEPTLEDIFTNMGENGAADGIGQLVSCGADMGRAKTEIKLQTQRYILGNAARMPARGCDWAARFLESMRDVWRDFDNARRQGIYEPYNHPADETAKDMRKEPPSLAKIYQFPQMQMQKQKS